ncbi:uncharacterized protein LOC111885939 [Lactuca sativa]|uniref:Uncharacterized protein n=1 Tax=Lactuca sativa TaxID=4236 RepID=A0A9R1XXR6_LACSA|nr:uncharacterized protein LOC111885939 [Lactuca sativa]KAJ0225272.1 hypothetical protein LSAT_V11C100030100 [Lactuca sativa]
MNDQRRYGMLMPGASRFKRKERESVYPAKRSPLAPPPPPPQKLTQATVASSTASKGSKGMEAMSSNKLLAGYMAHEFLTKGTLLGQKFDGGAAARGKTEANGNETYKEITSLLMMKTDGGGGGGARIPGIVNPTQLARWIQM